MKRGLLTLMLMTCAGLLVVYGCSSDNGDNGDADTDGDTDVDGDTDADGITDRLPDRDITSDPDITTDADVPPEITPDLPDTIDPVPDSTECNPLHGGVCNLIDNCGCDAGQTCQLELKPGDPCNVIEVCHASTGTLPTGAECDPSNDQCAPGSSCLTNSLTGESSCYKWCDGDEDCDAGHGCTISITYEMGGECPDLTLLYKACDLGCPPDAACDPFTGTGCSGTSNSCLYDIDCSILFCAPSGAHAIGEECSDTNMCVIGAECLTTDGGVTSYCYAFCDDSHACAEGTCQVFSPPYSGNPSLGVCVTE